MTHDERATRLASLYGTPQWEALKDLLASDLTHQRIDFSDPQWAAKKAYAAGRCDRALDLLKAVEKAYKELHPEAKDAK